MATRRDPTDRYETVAAAWHARATGAYGHDVKLPLRALTAARHVAVCGTCGALLVIECVEGRWVGRGSATRKRCHSAISRRQDDRPPPDPVIAALPPAVAFAKPDPLEPAPTKIAPTKLAPTIASVGAQSAKAPPETVYQLPRDSLVIGMLYARKGRR